MFAPFGENLGVIVCCFFGAIEQPIIYVFGRVEGNCRTRNWEILKAKIRRIDSFCK